jgi:hypothetical protein
MGRMESNSVTVGNILEHWAKNDDEAFKIVSDILPKDVLKKSLSLLFTMACPRILWKLTLMA